VAADWPAAAAAMGVVLIAELALLGALAGFLAGLLGIGGGMLMVPFLTWILAGRGVDPDLAVKMGIATAMATIVLTSLSSVRAHSRMAAVRWDIVRAMAPGVACGGLLAGGVALSAMRGRWLAVLFAAFAAWSATQLVRDRPPPPGRSLPSAPGLFAAGSGIGFAAGLVGAGGAFLTIPFLGRCNVAMRTAVGTSAAIGFPIALSNTVGYIIGGAGLPTTVPGAWGYLFLPAVVALAATSVSFAPLGAKVAHGIDVRRLERIFAVLQIALAASMLYRVFSG
jgi:uncharacterized membrane protein YfcA